jgi:hypothetical protein
VLCLYSENFSSELDRVTEFIIAICLIASVEVYIYIYMSIYIYVYIRKSIYEYMVAYLYIQGWRII